MKRYRSSVRKTIVMVGSFSLNFSSEVSLPGQALDGLGYGHQLVVHQHLSRERGAEAETGRLGVLGFTRPLEHRRPWLCQRDAASPRCSRRMARE
jgi:hypothetical protein